MHDKTRESMTVLLKRDYKRLDALCEFKLSLLIIFNSYTGNFMSKICLSQSVQGNVIK